MSQFCPHCNKEIFFKIVTGDEEKRIEKLVYERNKTLTQLMVSLKKENQDLKKRLEDASS